jgi:hypothetical protein
MVPKALTGAGRAIVEGAILPVEGREGIMAAKKKTSSRKRGGSASIGEGPQESATPTATAVVAEAMRTGVMPLASAQRANESNRGDSRLQGGDVDTNAMDNATVGDEAPGGSVSTPDQDRVDDIGRALGVQEVDSGELRTTSELMEERDRHRAQQDEPDPSTRD